MRIGACFLLAALLVVPSALSADARQDYLDGLRAVREARWSDALPLLERATKERPREEARARLVGAIPQPYLPWHYLGLAYLELGRCVDAERAWTTSDAYGAAARLAERLAERATAREASVASGRCPPAPTPPAPTAAIDFVPPSAPVPTPPIEERLVPVAVPAPESVPVAELHPALESAADAFAAGDLDRALDALGQVAAVDERNLALSAFLEAAICHARYHRGGRRDAGEERRARDAARRAQRLRPDLRPDPTLFSPRFVEWYRSVR